MARISKVPFEQLDSELQTMMRWLDKELGGSEFVQVFAHAPDVFKNFIQFYFPLFTETRGTVNVKLAEMCRIVVAEQNGCAL